MPPKSARDTERTRAHLVRVRIDGREALAEEGSTVLEAAAAQGISIPHLCYHPALGSPGECRVCLVEVGRSRELVPACSTVVQEGSEYWTRSEAVEKARADRIELLLSRHPRDCAACDRCGDCRLQDLCFAHGPERANATGEVRRGPPRRYGSRIAFRPERCVFCLRCVRFAEVASAAPALYIDWSSGRPSIELVPGLSLDDELSGNFLDLCPVGALLDSCPGERAPAWLLERRTTVCAQCSRGCAIEVQTFRGRIYRIAARPNPAVNGFWICDRGRYAIDAVSPAKRRESPSSLAGALGEGPANALALGLERVARTRGPEAVAGVLSAFATLEEILLFRQMFEALAVPSENLAAVARPPTSEVHFPNGFWISPDANPNRAGVEALLGPGAFEPRLTSIAERIEAGAIRAFVLMDARPACAFGRTALEEKILARTGDLDFLAVFELVETPWSERGVALPATGPFEKEGSVLSSGRIVQRLQRCVDPPRGVRPEAEILQQALLKLGARDAVLGPQGLLREVAKELGARHLDWERLDLGMPLELKE